MQAERRVHKDVPEVDRRLAELGLAQDLLLQAAQRGLAAFAACPSSPPELSSASKLGRDLPRIERPTGRPSISVDQAR